MLAILAIALAVVFLVVVATRPNTFTVRRSATIAAPAEVIYAQIHDFHRWPTWMSYDRMDPAIRRSFEGAPRGVGATYHYVSRKVGEGRMTITELQPNQRVALRAEFIKPFAAVNDIEFTLGRAYGGVRVTWTMSGKNTLMGKVLSVFVDMDRMIGRDFEKGLADLRLVSESEAHLAATPAAAAA